MRKFLTGTTLECLESIIHDRKIKINPPKRVWEDYSSEYIYLIPFEESDGENMDESFLFATEQSSFAIYELDGTKRVIIEISGIDESLLDEDPDASFYALRYPKDIPINYIDNIFIEDLNHSIEVNELIAITHLYRKTHSNPDYEILSFGDEDEKQHEHNRIGVKHLNLIQPCLFFDKNELDSRYFDLREDVDCSMKYTKLSFNEYLEKFASKQTVI